jgi:mannose-1-phosphate guanylyltransferase
MCARSNARSALYQPSDRGTAAGVLLALLPMLDRDPDAVVALTPADHAVASPRDFRHALLSTARLIARRRSGIVLFGAEPSGFDESYGWIRPGRPSSPAWLRAVDGFVEKPSAERADELLAARAVWNTMVLVASAASLLELFLERQPALTDALVAAWRSPADRRRAALTETYGRLVRLDFSHDVLTGAGGLTVYTWPASVGWSDLGTPDRLRAWLDAPLVGTHAAVSAA